MPAVHDPQKLRYARCQPPGGVGNRTTAVAATWSGGTQVGAGSPSGGKDGEDAGFHNESRCIPAIVRPPS
jgi:hypothetical protein